jgi:hypothetical protein
MSENPFQASVSTPEEKDVQSQPVQPDQAIYNVVVDTVTGVNARWSDNLFQAVFVGVSVVLIALIGAVMALLNPSWSLPWFGGALLGGFVGLVLGVLASGFYLMLYRASRHLKGKHD